ncbi:MAG: hypothetical protein JNL98_32745 [Bryobacterales bacterium]|nr:hypothetical protein [Bryobacterales bacterium]
MIPSIETIERAAAANLRDFAEVCRSVSPELHPEAVECGGGVAAFLGDGSPLTTVKGAGPDLAEEDMDAAEEFFTRKGAGTVTFELAPWISEAIAARLAARGYSISGQEDVVVHVPPYLASEPDQKIEPVSAAEWPDLMLRINGLAAPPLWQALVETCARMPDSVRLGVRLGDERVACAQMFTAAGCAIFGNDATSLAARGQGVQTALIRHRLRMIAGAGFQCAIAEVAPGSTSERNFVRCGFGIAYTRTHYTRILRRAR